jgi:hypothetical protein
MVMNLTLIRFTLYFISTAIRLHGEFTSAILTDPPMIVLERL